MSEAIPPASNSKLYAERDPYALSPHFERHMLALTGERLESKSAIAAELAHRDAEIELLDAAACNERAERESWQAIAKTRADEGKLLRQERDQWEERHNRERASHAKNLTEQRKVEAERDRLRAALSHVKGRAKLVDSATLLDITRLVDAALSGEPTSSPETEWSPPQPRPALEGPILPGERFIWEPDNAHAWAVVEVTKVGCPRNDERRIYTKILRGNGATREIWNDESRFREACIRAPSKAGENRG